MVSATTPRTLAPGHRDEGGEALDRARRALDERHAAVRRAFDAHHPAGAEPLQLGQSATVTAAVARRSGRSGRLRAARRSSQPRSIASSCSESESGRAALPVIPWDDAWPARSIPRARG